jgi:hypothetical protein
MHEQIFFRPEDMKIHFLLYLQICFWQARTQSPAYILNRHFQLVSSSALQWVLPLLLLLPRKFTYKERFKAYLDKKWISCYITHSNIARIDAICVGRWRTMAYDTKLIFLVNKPYVDFSIHNIYAPPLSMFYKYYINALYINVWTVVELSKNV